MPITITGQKYSGTLTSIGSSTRLVDSAALFSDSDFSITRLVSLWNSSGTTFKGFSYSRRRISSTEIELTFPFIDKDGNTVSRVTGDSYKVSKNFAESVTTGLSVSGSAVSVTDRITFGTSGSNDSVCFYDENKTITIGSGANSGFLPFFTFAGGISVFGYLENFASKSTSRSCTLLNQNGAINFPSSTAGIACSSTAAKLAWFGGVIFTQNNPVYMGMWFDNGLIGSPGEMQFYWDLFTNFDITAPGSWGSNQNYQQLVNVRSAVSGNNAICFRWANGLVQGGSYSVLGSAPMAISGADSSGTYAVSGSESDPFIVQDCGVGSKPVFWRVPDATITQTVNLLNVITPDRRFGINQDGSGGTTAATNVSGNFRYSGSYLGLVNSTLGLIKQKNLGSSIVASGTASDNKITLTVQEASVVGFTETITEDSWDYAFLLYQYQTVSGSFSTSTISVSGGQSAKIVRFGGVVGQVLDANITQSLVVNVAAYTGLETTDKLYDYAQYFKALNTTNALIPTLSTQLFSISAGALTTPWNITLDNSAGSVFAVNSGTSTVIVKASALSAGTKSDRFAIAANRTLTFAQNGDKSGVGYDVPATGIIVVPSGTTTLRGSVFASGATINRTSGSATVIVDQSQLANITAGTGVTLRSQVTITASWTGPSQAYVSIQVGGAEIINSGLTSSPYTYNYQWASGTPTVTVKILRQGFSRFTTSFTASASTQSINAALIANSTAYTGATNAALSITVDTADAAHKIRIGNAQIPVQTIYDVVEDAAIANPLRNNLQVFPTLTINGAYLTLNTSTQLIRHTAGDVNAAVLGAVFRSDGTNPIDGANGGVLLLGAQGLTPQQVRDAMALAVTSGTAIAAGSIDHKLSKPTIDV